MLTGVAAARSGVYYNSDAFRQATKASLARWLPATSAPQISYRDGAPRRDSNAWVDEAFQ